MATGRERRNERLNERLRGAQRTNIEDDSFHLDIAGLNIASSNSPALSTSRPTPNTSVKRKRLESDEAPPPQAQPTPSEGRQSIREGPRDPYELPDTSKESIQQAATEDQELGDEPEENTRVEEEPQPEPELPTPAAIPTPAAPESEPQPEPEPEPEPEEENAVESPPEQLPDLRRVSRNTVDEIEESPQDAPGSGKRRSVQMSAALSSTTRLHYALSTDDIGPPSSSPLAQKVRRRSSVAPSIRSRRSSRHSSQLAEDDEDELSPVQVRDRSALGHESELQPVEEEDEQDLGEDDVGRAPEEPEADDEAEATEEDAIAEEISATEAAKTIGRKRPRASPPQSPELGSAMVEEPSAEADAEEPAPKRVRGQRQRPSRSPAAQKQPAPKPKTKPTTQRPEPKSNANPKPKPKAAGKGRRTSKQREDGEDNGGSIEITVQRFVNVKKHAQDEDDKDPLHSEVPFSTRGETVVDVFAQVCTEVIESTIAQFVEAMGNTEDKAQKKEARTKIRAIESYRDELTSRLLQHAIHLNDWHALRKRVRLAQREKLSLREEIIRLRGEREQVALRMDAVRIKHEEDTKESKYRLDASSTMHDVDLTIERGRDAPELSRAEQKQAELANLELLVAQITDEASSKSAGGGMLQQVKDFNAFLERAAVALESR